MKIENRTSMAKRGRPSNKTRARYASGRAKPDVPGGTYGELHRLRSLACSAILSTELGRLWYLGELTRQQVDVGCRIAEIHDRYDRAMGRRRSVASPDYERDHGRRSEAVESDRDRERSEQAVRIFCDVAAELGLLRPRKLSDMVQAVCVDNRHCPVSWLPELRTALDALAGAVGVTGRKRRIPALRPSPAPRVPERVSKPVIAYSSLERQAFQVMLPSLSPDRLEALYRRFSTLRDRAKFEAEKALGSSKF